MSLDVPTRRERVRERIAAEILAALVSTTRWSPSQNLEQPRAYADMAVQFTNALINRLYP